MVNSDLTEIIGRRDSESLDLALEANWEDWRCFESSESVVIPYLEQLRRIEECLLMVISGEKSLALG